MVYTLGYRFGVGIEPVDFKPDGGNNHRPLTIMTDDNKIKLECMYVYPKDSATHCQSIEINGKYIHNIDLETFARILQALREGYDTALTEKYWNEETREVHERVIAKPRLTMLITGTINFYLREYEEVLIPHYSELLTTAQPNKLAVVARVLNDRSVERQHPSKPGKKIRELIPRDMSSDVLGVLERLYGDPDTLKMKPEEASAEYEALHEPFMYYRNPIVYNFTSDTMRLEGTPYGGIKSNRLTVIAFPNSDDKWSNNDKNWCTMFLCSDGRYEPMRLDDLNRALAINEMKPYEQKTFACFNI